MERTLLQLEKERDSVAPWQVQVKDVKSLVAAAGALAEALRQAAAAAATSSSQQPSSDRVDAEWLLQICSTVQSELGAPRLARAIWSAAQLTDEAQQQAALFDALGEGGMDVLFQVAEKLSQIRLIPEEQLGVRSVAGGDGGISAKSAETIATSMVDPQEERRQRLLQEARDATHVAAIAKADADSMAPGGGAVVGTHTVTRQSHVDALKVAKRAQRRANAAMQAARDAGAIVDESELMSIEQSAMGSGGLMGQSQEAIWALQQSLLPEGSKQHYDKMGLPKETEREYGEDYEKVTIPAPKRDEATLPRRLLISEIMDSRCCQAFAGTASLNPMQSLVFDTAFHNRDNMLVCAPTGAGKTNVAMLTVVAHFRDVGLISGKDTRNMETGGKKVVYIAPMKALAQEVVSKFHSKLSPLKLIVRELTGDMQLTRAEAESANVIVTTPEKWDVVTRKSGNDEKSLGNQCGLLIIDEVHLLADERGAVIESVVARLHRLVESRQRQVRIVGLSATLPNYQDVATFLQVPERGLFYFGPEHRPVPLQQSFIGVIAQTRDRFVKEKKMNEMCYDVVVDSLRRGYQVMVFVHSRKGTSDTANALAERAAQNDELERWFVTQGKDGPEGEANKRYTERVKKSRNREVGNHFAHGMGIHHAGMLRGDRKLTEQMFADGAIKVLCCTATLAWGINLPAHTVVIKGTEVYNPEKGGLVDLSILDVMQIFGRAGRPQFDTSGEAILITSHDALPRYLDKLVREVPIESNFIKQLPDHLNAEIVGGTVTNIKEAATWLTYTYLHVRMVRNPLAYGITADQKADDPMLRGRSVELVQDAARLLAGNEMARYDIESGNLSVCDLGRTAAHYYIQAESVATFNDKAKLGGFETLSDAELSHLICCATEFENVKIRQEELNELDTLAKKACPLPVKTPIHDPSDKSLVLMQAFVSRAGIKSFTLVSDTNYVASNAGRVARALFEMCLKRNNAGPTIKLLRIAKSVDKRFWWFQTPLRHFEAELKDNVFRALESRKAGYDTFESALSLLDMQHQEVGELCHQARNGKKIQRFVRMLPRLEVQCNVLPVSSSVLRFHICLRPIWEWQTRWHGGAEAFWLWVEDGENDRIYHNEYVIFSRRTHPEETTLDLSLPAFDPLPKQYFIRVVSDSWVGVEMLLPVSFEDIQLPSQRPHHTDLYDLTPLPTTALQDASYEQLYSKIQTFNPIQTQLFHVLYHTDSPVLLGAPTGSGKTIVAELAILRMKRLYPKGICVYIAPLKSLARERLKEWQARLGAAPLKWRVLELSGDTHHDQKALNQADVLVCTPEKWDLISRGWRGAEVPESNVANGKAFVKRVRLLVIDEIHLLGEERGAVLEAIVSRTRFISKFVEAEKNGTQDGKVGHELIRIVGLSTALANAIDLADWIGIDTKGHRPTAMRGLYNFRPSVRPIPMDVHIQGFAGRHYCPRMATMNKPCYAAIKEYSPHNPTLIFVASRRQTRLTAFDLISYAAGDENPRAFLGCSEDYIESVADTIQDDSLRHTLTFGIGLHHAGLSSRDRDTVERLFLGGEIQVLVATATLAWGVNLPARFVIVKGTEYFDGKQSRYVDYPITDVLQMIGRAGRPGFDTEGKALVMVEESKKIFYKKFLYLPFPVESCLRDRMCENLNAEIAIGTINSLHDAVGYLAWTFYARRVAGNPSYYGAASRTDEDVEAFLLSVVQDTIQKLSEHGCVEAVRTKDEIDVSLHPTPLGSASSNYYLQFRTPKQMLFGVKEARRLVIACIEEGEPSTPTASAPSNRHVELKPFARSKRSDEVTIAWILYALSSTHEFDELPVRHNEEHLNASLCEEVMWGADTSTVIQGGNGENARRAEVSMDVMADPHTKCFLLIQAYLEHTKLPISDYVNDTKSVIDQIPRLLAAMQYIALQDRTATGSFELACQFSRVRQILETRTLVEEDPWIQTGEVSQGALRKMESNSKSKKQALPSLREVRAMPRDDAAKTLQKVVGKHSINVERVLDYVFALPSISVQSAKVSQYVEKTTGKTTGKLSVELVASHEGRSSSHRTKRSSAGPVTLALVLGTPQRRVLLAHHSVGMGRSGSVKKTVNLTFDWNSANADGGESGGAIVLRLLFEDVRGLDSELTVPLR